MAHINGFVNGVPARIPEGFVQLWPDVYSAEPPASKTEPTPTTAKAQNRRPTGRRTQTGR